MNQLKKVATGQDLACLAGKDSGSDMNTQSAVAVPGQVQSLPKVAILLCTYHGQHYLAEQLESFAAQTHSNWEVWASDDGSQDGTHAILECYQVKWGAQRLSMHIGPAEGFAANFLSLTCKADIEADYYAYSDQDDIWEPDHLSRALDWLCSDRTRKVVLHSAGNVVLPGGGCRGFEWRRRGQHHFLPSRSKNYHFNWAISRYKLLVLAKHRGSFWQSCPLCSM